MHGYQWKLLAVMALSATVMAQNPQLTPQQQQNLTKELQSSNFVNRNASWYETWTPNAPAEYTQNASLPNIWITGVSGTAVRTQMAVLIRDSINTAQQRTGLWLNYTISNVSITPWINNTVSFAMGITPLSTSNLWAAGNASSTRGRILEFPIYLGSISLFHSVPGVNIRLDGPTAAQIFQGNITMWNDPQIASVMGVDTSSLPNERIKLAVRNDSTAQTGYIATYFNQTYPGWVLGTNNTLAWNNWATFNGNGSQQCANYVSQNPYAITYLESWSGNNQSSVDETFWEVPLKNAAGQFQTSTNAQWQTMAVVLPRPPGRWNNANFINLPDDNVFPVIFPTYVYTNGDLTINGTVGAAIKQLYGYWLSNNVQGNMLRNYRAHPLPERILAAAVRYYAAVNASTSPAVGWPSVDAARYMVAAS